MKRKFLLTIFFIAVILYSASNGFAQNRNINISVDGNLLEFTRDSGKPFLDQNSRTQVPFRLTLETFGADVDWDQESNTAIARKDGITVKVPIGEKYILVNGNKLETDTAALVRDNRTYLPIRVVLESFGSKVVWNNSSATVEIYSDPTSYVEESLHVGNLPKIFTSNHSVLVKEDNSLWTWGSNDSGQLGTGKRSSHKFESPVVNNDSYKPVKVMDNIVWASVGEDFTLALDKDKNLYGFGSGSSNTLGNTSGYLLKPEKIAENVIYVASDRNVAAIIKDDNSLWIAGVDFKNTRSFPIETTNKYYKVLDNVRSVSLTNDAVVAVTLNDELYMMGNPKYMGEKFESSDPNPAYINTMSKIMDGVKYGNIEGQIVQIINTRGELYSWGFNGFSNTIGGEDSSFHLARPAKIMDNVVYARRQMALDSNNTLYMWGEIQSVQDEIYEQGYRGGALGPSLKNFGKRPARVLENIVSISHGNMCYAIDKNGNVYGIGSNQYGLSGTNINTIWKEVAEEYYHDVFIHIDNEIRSMEKLFNINDL